MGGLFCYASFIVFQMLDQLVDHTDQHIAQQSHGNQKHFAVGLAGGVIVNGIGHDSQDQQDGTDDFHDGFHKYASRIFFFPIISVEAAACQWVQCYKQREPDLWFSHKNGLIFQGYCVRMQV